MKDKEYSLTVKPDPVKDEIMTIEEYIARIQQERLTELSTTPNDHDPSCETGVCGGMD